MIRKNQNLIRIILLILLSEKIIQHALTALAFTVAIPGVGSPSIGNRFEISDLVMAISNSILVVLFGISILGIIKGKSWSKTLVIILASFDIVAEFIFHGLFYITISVIVSAFLIILMMIFPDKK
jgi:hypothetical protein